MFNRLGISMVSCRFSLKSTHWDVWKFLGFVCFVPRRRCYQQMCIPSVSTQESAPASQSRVSGSDGCEVHIWPGRHIIAPPITGICVLIIFYVLNGLTTKGKSTGNHRFSHEIWDFPVIFPLNQSIHVHMGMWWVSNLETMNFEMVGHHSSIMFIHVQHVLPYVYWWKNDWQKLTHQCSTYSTVCLVAGKSQKRNSHGFLHHILVERYRMSQ